MSADENVNLTGNPTNGQSAPDASASTMPLFYKNPVPLDSEKHTNLGMKKNFGLAFTRQVNAVPLNLIEMPQICHFYPIAFSPDNNATPVAILGLRDNENLFVDEDGNWLENTYIPAYIRRYPFIFSEMPGSEQLSLCIDMDSTIVEEGGGEKFFDASGQPTELSNNALEFCKSYHAAAQQTMAFSQELAESGLLVERQAEIKLHDDKKINFSGFKIIDEKKLAELNDEIFLNWRKKGWLSYIYAHLFSGSQWQRLSHLLNTKLKV